MAEYTATETRSRAVVAVRTRRRRWSRRSETRNQRTTPAIHHKARRKICPDMIGEVREGRRRRRRRKTGTGTHEPPLSWSCFRFCLALWTPTRTEKLWRRSCNWRWLHHSTKLGASRPDICFVRGESEAMYNPYGPLLYRTVASRDSLASQLWVSRSYCCSPNYVQPTFVVCSATNISFVKKGPSPTHVNSCSFLNFSIIHSFSSRLVKLQCTSFIDSCMVQLTFCRQNVIRQGLSQNQGH